MCARARRRAPTGATGCQRRRQDRHRLHRPARRRLREAPTARGATTPASSGSSRPRIRRSRCSCRSTSRRPAASDRFGGTAAAPVFAELVPTMIHELDIQPAARLDAVSGVIGAWHDAIDAIAAPPTPRRPAGACRPARRRRVVGDPGDLVRPDARLPPGPPGQRVRLRASATHHDGHQLRRRRGRRRGDRRCSSTTLVDVRRRPARRRRHAPGDGPGRRGRPPATRAGALPVVGITGTNGKTTTTHLLGADPARRRADATTRDRHAVGHEHDARGDRSAAPARRATSTTASTPS